MTPFTVRRLFYKHIDKNHEHEPLDPHTDASIAVGLEWWKISYCSKCYEEIKQNPHTLRWYIV